MGRYVNPGNKAFEVTKNTNYIDKTGMISLLNKRIGTSHQLVLVSRSRRFGKSTAVKMLCAYYDCTCDSKALFDDLEIAINPEYNSQYNKYLNSYNVLSLDVATFLNGINKKDIVSYIEKEVKSDVCRCFPEVELSDNLSGTLLNVVKHSGKQFVAIIDEWDVFIRNPDISNDIVNKYMEFLRSLFKDATLTDEVFAIVYMTGILPIKKDGSQSAISNFSEFTMLNPREFAPYVGFTEEEVKLICRKDGLNFRYMKEWYDGYSFPMASHIYNPNSVMNAIENQSFESYWGSSASSESLLYYISMDFGGLSKDVECLMAGIPVKMNPRKFINDTSSLRSRDDVLTLLVHFGYLSYDTTTGMARIPNAEIMLEFSAVKNLLLQER